LRLLTVNMTLDPTSGGGSAARTVQVTRVLHQSDVTCAIVSAGDGLDDDLRATLRGVDLVTVPVIFGRFRVPRGGFRAVSDAVRTADVVMLINHWTLINVLAWCAIRHYHKPYVVCPAGALPPEGGRSATLKQVYNAVVGRRLVAEADAHIAVTPDETRQFEPYGISPSRVTVIPNGMPDVQAGDSEAFRARHHLGPGPLLLFMGRLAPIKGPDLLIGAFGRCAAVRPDWHLVMAGPDDGMGETLRGQVERLGLRDRVHFVGFLGDTAKADALAAADLVVVPSRREAMSIVVLEAAAAGRAVLVTDQCGIPSVSTSDGGWVVEATEAALAAGLLEATGDRSALVSRGQRWQTEARRHFSWETVGAQYRTLFREVIARHGKTAPPR